MPKISVIVPVYKVDKYLPQCIESILNQTFTDFELLLIDDGSPDRSGEICNNYAAEDSRIRVFHKINGGVSSARNLGLCNSKGEWITFVDADDWIDDDFLECLFKESFTNDLVGVCHTVVFPTHRRFVPYAINEYGKLNKDAILKFKKSLIGQSSIDDIEQLTSCWAYLYKKEYCANISFPSIRIGEDFIFLLRYVFKCSNIHLINKSKYNYRTVGDSATGRYHLGLNKDYKLLIVQVENLLKEYSLYDNFRDVFNNMIIKYSFGLVNNHARCSLFKSFYLIDLREFINSFNVINLISESKVYKKGIYIRLFKINTFLLVLYTKLLNFFITK